MLGFTIGLRTLRAAQLSMDAVGNNVANASTPGYARRLSQLATTDPQWFGSLSLGTGVTVEDLRRVHDGLLEIKLRQQRSSLGRLDASGGLLSQMESAFQEPGDSGIAARLDEMWGSLSSLTTFPDDSSYRAGLVQSAQSLAGGFRDLAASMQDTGTQASQSVRSGVDQVNALLADLANLNRQALRSHNLNSTPADLADERDRLLGELADWVDGQAITRPDGTTDVLIDGLLVVSGDRARPLAADTQADGSAKITLADSDQELDVGSGQLRGYLDFASNTVPQRQAELAAVARSLMLEVNRIHTTGVGAIGPNAELLSAVAVPADRVDDALSTLDLPFPISAGRLTVNVVDSASGSVTQQFLDVDPDKMSLNDLAAALDGIDHVSASVDPAGRLRVAADAGFGFDFSSRLDVDPDDAGSFGSDAATLTSGAGPFALNNGDTIAFSVNGGTPATVTFNAASFVDITHATAEEVAAAIEAQLPGVSARAQDGRLVVSSDAAGSASSLQVTAASNAALFAVGASDVGSATAVSVDLSGAPTAGHTGHYTVRALTDGVVGLTPGLQVELLDGSGTRVGTFDVGSNYVPGDPIELVPGVKLSLSAGSIEQSAGDVFEFDLVGDSDEGDVLVGLQLGAFFTGSGAFDIALADEVANDPRRIAGSLTGAPNDGSGFEALLGLKDQTLADLSGRSIAQGYGDLVAGVGFDVQSNESAAASQTQLLTALQSRRDEISGVNTDEEMVKLIEYQHLYQAAGRYLQTVSQMTDTLFTMFL